MSCAQMQGIFLHTLEHHIGALVDYDLPALIDRHIRESLVLFAGLHFQFGPRQQLIHDLISRNHAFQTSV